MADAGHVGERDRGSREGSPALSDMSRDSLDMDTYPSESHALRQPSVEGGDSPQAGEGVLAVEAMDVQQTTGEVEDAAEQSARTTPTVPEDGSWAREMDAVDWGERVETEVSEEDEVLTGSVSEGTRTPSEGGRGPSRARRRKKRGPRRKRAPVCQRPPKQEDVRRFLSDAFTQAALYPGMYQDGHPSPEVQYLADEETGKPQHTYALDKSQAYGGAEPCAWMGQGQHDSRTPDKKPELRWEGVSRRVRNLGHTHYPKLHPEVTVLNSSLPRDRVTRRSCQLLYLAWLHIRTALPRKRMRALGCA